MWNTPSHRGRKTGREEEGERREEEEGDKKEEEGGKGEGEGEGGGEGEGEGEEKGEGGRIFQDVFVLLQNVFLSNRDTG